MPGRGIERAGDRGRGSGHRRLGAPGVELAGGGDAEHIALAGPAHRPPNPPPPKAAAPSPPEKCPPRRDGPLVKGGQNSGPSTATGCRLPSTDSPKAKRF